jgi:hypothetical protein
VIRRIPVSAALPALIVLAVAGYGVWLLTDDDSAAPPAPIDVAAAERAYDTIDQLAGASDLVVQGAVVAIEPGRALTDPADPTAGVRTQLVSVDVESVVKGDAATTVVIEQEATLLDGTPITVNGAAALHDGDRGWFFLIEGDGEQFPYTALTSSDGFVATGSDRAPAAAALQP